MRIDRRTKQVEGKFMRTQTCSDPDKQADEERNKREGWSLYKSGSTPSERARGLFIVIESHFHRNPKAPSLATSASHWLWAQQGHHDKAVMDLLVARYPLPRCPRIQRGYSDWNSYGDPNYKFVG